MLENRFHKISVLCPFILISVIGLCQCDGQNAASDVDALTWAEQTLSDLSLEEKIGQLICVDITADYIAEDDPRFQSWVRLARDYGVGGFVLYGGTPRDVAFLLNSLQNEAELPLLMSADFEGGPGQQVRGASEFPANMAFAAAGSEDLMYRAASIGSVEGRAMGIHLTYTPVVDISVRPENPSESVRSFGGDLDFLGCLVRAYVKGYHENGMLTTAKHFPGRGDIEVFPEFPQFRFINKPAEKVESQEFQAFKLAVDAGVDFVMSEHIAVPSVTEGSSLPASVEGRLVTGWLREKLGFGGVLTTDDLWYDHVIQRFGPVEVALKALEAGHDVLLKPKDPVAVIEGVAEAVKSGRIPESRIDHSVVKLLVLKARLGLHKNRLVDEDQVNTLVGTPAHLAVVQEVADRSITLLKNEGVLPVKEIVGDRTINVGIQKYEDDPSPAALSAKLSSAFPGIRNYVLRSDTDTAVYDTILSGAHEADLVILSLFVQRTRQVDNAPFRERDLKFIKELFQTGAKSIVAMSYGNPFLIRKIDEVPAFLVGFGERGWYGNQAVYFDSFIKLLKGDLAPQGKLPVKVSDLYPLGFGLSY
ncbi:MAG: glycoside hydrolase family 3 C-terminal domain-containing protein [Candidatus Aminicenantes bacterium]|nr:MAG: glycoside hydrolase family 3 C-terminal domain-containing protein [Candidatus Aminicenantes bacterium]